MTQGCRGEKERTQRKMTPWYGNKEGGGSDGEQDLDDFWSQLSEKGPLNPVTSSSKGFVQLGQLKSSVGKHYGSLLASRKFWKRVDSHSLWKA